MKLNRMQSVSKNFTRPLSLVLYDLTLFGFSYLMAFFLRFEMKIPGYYLKTLLATLPLVMMIRMITFWFFKLYKKDWRYISLQELLSIFFAVSVGSSLIAGCLIGYIGWSSYPKSILIIDWYFVIVLTGGLRFTLRLFREGILKKVKSGIRVLIVGAGDAGESILREINKNSQFKYFLVGLIDDDPKKQGLMIHGIKVLGNLQSIPQIVTERKVEEIIIAIPSATRTQMIRILQLCREAKVRVQTVPTLAEIINGHVQVSLIREVKPEDILGREQVKWDIAKIAEEFRRRRILVTGAGGSIGSELCRQVARLSPEILILFERTENNLFYLEHELRRNFPEVPIAALIADVTDENSTSLILTKYRPEIIFHAAAYKHVPLMELNPEQAIKNNILGTRNIALAASENGINKFIFISTDKAVNPTNFMGVSKKIGERYIQAISSTCSTKFFSVRFGNVMGSSGSVMELFKRQIARGGPVTVTHAEVSRYFMTIPEAVHLVLRAVTLGKGGEIFILDMGEPIRIFDLARELIIQSGFEPEKDIEIKYSGLRPGEKLSEELFEKDEQISSTPDNKIFVVRNSNSLDLIKLDQNIDELVRYANQMNRTVLIEKLKEIVPDFQSSQSENLQNLEIEHISANHSLLFG